MIRKIICFVVLGFCLSICQAAKKNIEKPWFKMKIPSNFTMEDNKKDTIILGGTEASDGMPDPFITINYWHASNAEKSQAISILNNACRIPREDFFSIFENRLSVHSRLRGNSIVEYTVRTMPFHSGTVSAAFYCGPNFTLSLSILYSKSKIDYEVEFSEILRTLQFTRFE